MDSDRSDHNNLLDRHRRRLSVLKQREATFGINAPAELIIEIEDLQGKIKKLESYEVTTDHQKDDSLSEDITKDRSYEISEKKKQKMRSIIIISISLAIIVILFLFYRIIYSNNPNNTISAPTINSMANSAYDRSPIVNEIIQQPTILPQSYLTPTTSSTSTPLEIQQSTRIPLKITTPTLIDRSPTVTILKPQNNEYISQIVTVKIHFLNVPSNMTMWIYVIRPGAQYYTDEIMPDNCLDNETCEQDVEIGTAVRTDVPYRLGILLADPPATENLRAHSDARDTLPTGVTKFSPIVVIRQ